jgi:acetyl esterase/lipase
VSYAFDPELAAAVELLPKLDLNDLQGARDALKKLRAELPAPDATGVTVTDVLIAGPAGAPEMPLRIYRPDVPSGPVGVFDVHGGGFILGDLEMVHASNLTLAREVGAVVVSVDYRLAPEDPYPAGLEDCYAGLVWFAEHAEEYGVDPDRIAIHGISAGGGLCAGLALLARDRGGPAIAFQYLGVPEVDDRLGTASMTAYIDTPLWNQPNAVLSWAAYLGAGVPGTADVPVYAAPARASDLSGLPPAYVSTMEFDPLRDEGIAYALALQAAGVQVELHMFPGTFHGSSLVEHAVISQLERSEEITVLRRGLRL